MDILSRAEQRTLCKCIVDPALWSQVIFFNNDDISTMVKKVEEAFDKLQPLFSRKVKFLNLMIMKGEEYLESAMKINEISEWADLDSIQSQDLKLMK